ncbi:HEAT repeat-containing protein 5B, partial [Coemansia sp. RSA 2681]
MSSSATTVSLGTITAYGRDAAIVHPNSTTHHGRSPDEQRHAIAAALSTPDADYAFVCARADVDAFDARAVLGHLVSSLLLVFGPELQVDDATRDSVLTLLRELRRALPSAGVIISTTTAFSPSMELSLVADPDARWQTAAQFIFATQKQLLFFAPKDPAFLPLFVSNTLRPIMRARRAAYYGHSSGIHSFHRVAVQALEGVLRLYGSQIIENAGGSWTLCDIVWESLVLYSIVSGEKQQQRQSGGVDSVKELLDDDLRRLIHTTASLACTLEYSQLEHGDGDIPETMAVVGALCAVFTKRATAAMPHAIRRLLGTTTGSPSSAGDGEDMTALGDDTDARPFSSAAKQLAIAAIVATLDCVDRLRPAAIVNNNNSSSSKPNVIVQWRSHPLTPLLADLVSVGYMAASAPATQSPTLCCLGQHLLQRLIAQFGDVEDPALRGEGQSVLGIYQAQLSSAFMPVLGETIGNNNQSSPEIVQAAVITATAFVVSGLVNSDRATLTRILRLLAPQPVFFSTTTTTTRRDIGDQTPQMKVIARLTILHAWATIYGYATSRGGGEGILWDALDLHMPLLSCLWMDAIRDTAVIGMRPRDVYEELAHHSCHPNPYDGDEPDIGMGLSLGLESTYVGMVREPLAVWYRAYLPHFLGSISKLLILGKSDAAHTSKCGYDELLARLRGSGSGTGTTADLAVLLFGFTLQELTRLSVLSSVTRYAQAGLSGGGGGGGSNDFFPFVAASARLVGPLDVGGGGSAGQSRGNDTESERIASLQRAGIRVYGPTQPASSAIGAQWLADMDFVSSLLSTLQAILDLNYPTPLPSQEMSAGLTVLFSATNSTASSTSDKAVTRSWLVEELWTHAVSNIVAPLCDSNNGVVDAQQRANRSLRVTAATKALDVALSLLTLLGATKATVEATAAAGESMLDQWLFAGKRSEDTSIAADGDVPALLGLCAFGRTVVRDIVSTWQAAQQNLLQNEEDNGGSAEEEKKEALDVASACLEILAMVIGRRHCDSAPLVAFWLGLWRRQSMLAFTSQPPDAAAAAAAASLTGFVRRTTACYGTVDIVNGGDMLSGDANMLSGDVGLVQSMINALLLQLLQSEADT